MNRKCGSCKWYGDCEVLKVGSACPQHQYKEKVKPAEGRSMVIEIRPVNDRYRVTINNKQVGPSQGSFVAAKQYLIRLLGG